MSREAMQLALEALEDANDVARMEFSDEDYYSEAINALRQALVDADDTSQKRVDETAKREHEPWPSVQCTCGGTIYFKHTKREWVGLTDEEISYCRYAATFCDELDTAYMAELIEKDLKEKNR